MTVLTKSLAELANAIRAHLTTAATHGMNMLQSASLAGERLLEAKEQVNHGEWGSWLKENCDLGERQAQRFMRLAKHWEEIEQNADPDACVSLNGALAAISKQTKALPSPEPSEPTESDNETPPKPAGGGVDRGAKDDQSVPTLFDPDADDEIEDEWTDQDAGRAAVVELWRRASKEKREGMLSAFYEIRPVTTVECPACAGKGYVENALDAILAAIDATAVADAS